MDFDREKAIEEINRDLDEKIEDSTELYKLFIKTTENLINTIDKLPEGERQKQLDSYQMMVMIASRLSYLIQYTLKMTSRNSRRIDYLMYYSNGGKGQQTENLKPLTELEEDKEHKKIMEW